MDAVFHLFTYGTLTSRGGASHVLGRCERVGAATTRGTLYDVGSFPALLAGGTDRVEGEIWRCHVEALPRLDEYEGVADGLFRRIGRRIADMPCWLYVAGPALGARLTPEARIASGRWEREEACR